MQGIWKAGVLINRGKKGWRALLCYRGHGSEGCNSSHRWGLWAPVTSSLESGPWNQFIIYRSLHAFTAIQPLANRKPRGFMPLEDVFGPLCSVRPQWGALRGRLCGRSMPSPACDEGKLIIEGPRISREHFLAASKLCKICAWAHNL